MKTVKDEENRRLVTAFQKSNKLKKQRYLNELYALNEGLIVFLVNKYVIDKNEFADLKSEAYIVLLNCARNFDTKRRIHFSSYFASSIRRQAYRLYQKNKLIHVPEADMAKINIGIVRLDKPIGENSDMFFEIPIEQDFDTEINKYNIDKIMKNVLDKESIDILKMYFWQGMTFKQIGDKINKGHEAARSKIHRSLWNLKQYLKSKNIQDIHSMMDFK